METKSFRVAELKATPEDGPGTFRAIVSVFGTPDMGKDIVERGAFKQTLQERGLPPIVWSHQWDTPPIGATLKAEERQEGLYIKGRLFVGEDEDSPMARAVYTAMRAKDGNGSSPLREFSFGYEAKDVEFKEIDGEQHRILKRVDLFEAGPTLVGMHPDTRLMGVKALGDELAATQQRLLELQKSNPDLVAAVMAAVNGGIGGAVGLGFAAKQEEPNDKPEPKPAEGEEAQARISRLLAEHPQHVQETT